jgi:hypothetical protein
MTMLAVLLLHHLLKLLARYFVRRLQQSLGDLPNPELVPAQ